MKIPYTPITEKCIALAAELAQKHLNAYIAPEHLILAMLQLKCGGELCLCKLGVPLDELKAELEKLIGKVGTIPMKIVPPNEEETDVILRCAVLEARHMKASSIGTQHILLSALFNHEIWKKSRIPWEKWNVKYMEVMKILCEMLRIDPDRKPQ